MDLKSGYPWWAIRNGLLHAFPALDRDLRCDVVVLGAGITGALIADELAGHGHEVAVIDRRDVGWGSTAASTALLQYEIDMPMTDLAHRYGEGDAVLAYRACADAIGLLREKATAVGRVDFAMADSLYYASKPRHLKPMLEEYAMRQRHGFPVRWLESGDVAARFGFAAPGAILSRLAATVDPYRFCYRLLQRLERAGTSVFDRTTVARVLADARGVALHTTGGCVIRARHLVVAAGYESQALLGVKVARNRSSYAFVTDPIQSDALQRLHGTMLWESARPYLYLRTTRDGRVIAGGEDDAIDIPDKRDARLGTKTTILMGKIQALLPDVPVQPVFSWAGTFAETEDGLPFFGPHRKHGPRVHFAMAYGGNGITYSMLGAGLLRALIERRKHPLAELFSFARLDR